MRQAAAIRLRNDRQMVSWMKENTNPIVGSTKWSWLFAVEPETYVVVVGGVVITVTLDCCEDIQEIRTSFRATVTVNLLLPTTKSQLGDVTSWGTADEQNCECIRVCESRSVYYKC